MRNASVTYSHKQQASLRRLWEERQLQIIVSSTACYRYIYRSFFRLRLNTFTLPYVHPHLQYIPFFHPYCHVTHAWRMEGDILKWEGWTCVTIRSSGFLTIWSLGKPRKSFTCNTIDSLYTSLLLHNPLSAAMCFFNAAVDCEEWGSESMMVDSECGWC